MRGLWGAPSDEPWWGFQALTEAINPAVHLLSGKYAPMKADKLPSVIKILHEAYEQVMDASSHCLARKK